MKIKETREELSQIEEQLDSIISKIESISLGSFDDESSCFDLQSKTTLLAQLEDGVSQLDSISDQLNNIEYHELEQEENRLLDLCSQHTANTSQKQNMLNALDECSICLQCFPRDKVTYHHNPHCLNT